MNEFELRRQLRTLARERAPQHDLWPAIAQRIDALPSRRGLRWQPWAAAAVLLIAAGGTFRWFMPESAHAPATPVAATPTAAKPLLLREADMLNLEYRAALAEFGAPLPRELQPAATTLNASAEELRAALRDYPDNPYLLNQLRRTYDLRLRLNQLASLG